LKGLHRDRKKKFVKSVDKTKEVGYIDKCAVERDKRSQAHRT